MKRSYVYHFILLIVLAILLSGCGEKADVRPTNGIESTPTAILQLIMTPAAEVFDPQELLEQALQNFLTASSLRITTHDITSYQSIAADGTVLSVYGEFNSTYDLIRSPETKMHVHSEYRFSPQSAFYDEEYYLLENDGATTFVNVNEDGTISREDLGIQPVEMLLGDAVQAITEFGINAEFQSLENGEAIYLLEPPSWYLLSGAVRFADLGLLLGQPDSEEQIRAYAEAHYPNVKPAKFILHVSIADQVITAIEGDNRDFMLSFWEAYDQALVEQGADPTQLTQYEVQPENGGESLIGNYNQVPDFAIPE